eukprot:TRINITY_DN7317_c0_g1_i1.p2 TRINITY_DN7317_c0_g1~~TRINITY_DN7317_c0_g1_i1.p2  ORF type:complete len:155 (+),score=21.77 TRINITY_DN7317_c0_g1_i1:278-742(+)
MLYPLRFQQNLYPTNIILLFSGKSHYNDTFVAYNLANRAHPAHPLPAIKNEAKFMGITTKMTDYAWTASKARQLKNREYLEKKKEARLSLSHPGQYLTSSQYDFAAKALPGQCELKDLPIAPKFNNSVAYFNPCLLYTSPSPRDLSTSRMPSSA